MLSFKDNFHFGDKSEHNYGTLEELASLSVDLLLIAKMWNDIAF